jgi:L-threonylcarbamoyladenylate synthase
MPEAARVLAERFWPGPLTLVVPRDSAETVGLRCPDCAALRQVVDLCGVPVAAPSANLSGDPPAVSAREVMDIFEGRIEAVLDGGQARMEQASTVVSVADDEVKILRPGGITEEDLRDALRQAGCEVSLS